MRDEYDIQQLNPRKNPYIEKKNEQIMIPLNENLIAYLKKESMRTGILYPTLMRLYLEDCMKKNKKIGIRE